MFSIENICKKVSGSIAKELSFNTEKEAIINYGVFAIVQIMFSVIIVGIFGVILGVLVEALIILATISILRQQSGGMHASSPEVCTFIGTVLSVGMALIITRIKLDAIVIISVGIIFFMWSYYIIYKLAPVDSPAKPIRTDVKKKRLKKSSILILSVYLFIVIGNIIGYYVTKKSNLLVYSGCIYIGLMWQVFSLTKSGHVVLGKLDALFK